MRKATAQYHYALSANERFALDQKRWRLDWAVRPCGKCRHEVPVRNFTGAVKGATGCWSACALNAVGKWRGLKAQ
jgi:hypothetical protein